MKSNCQLVTVWDGGTEIRTNAFFNKKTKEVISHEAVDAEVEVLEQEYIEFEDGETREICKTCHSFVLVPRMVPSGKTLVEVNLCADSACESNA